MSAAPDVIDRIAEIAPDSPLAALRAQRQDAVRHSQGSYEALFAPASPNRLTTDIRLAAALRVALLSGEAALAVHYRDRLAAEQGGADLATRVESFPAGPFGPHQGAILHHVDLVTRTPREAGRTAIATLRDAGLGEPEIVTLSQIVAFVSYQARLLAGLRLLRGEA